MPGKVQVYAFVLSDNAGREPTGKLHIQGVFDKIFCQRFPAAHAHMSAYLKLRFEGGPGTSKIGIVSRPPSGLEEHLPPFDVRFGVDGKMEAVFNVQGFPLPEPGTYAFMLFADGELIAEYDLEAVYLQPSLLPPPQGSHGSPPN